ncbi:MAG: tRNA dihydrouridine synthase DusB [Arenicella sp.]
MQIGPITLANSVIAAPMAGVSDRPYRQVARAMGAGLAVSEMLTSQVSLRHTTKSKFRMNIHEEAAPVSVQLVGTEPHLLAEAAQFNVANGADIIDINMGCPAKKVCKKLAGSSLLGDAPLVERIVSAVVNAVPVPVTLKIRTGLVPEERNVVQIARIAQENGIQALTIHGRTRQCKFVGPVEYDSIAEAKRSVSIPVIANGDIDSPEKAAAVLKYTGADAVMIGRATQGQPWLLRQIAHFLETGESLLEPVWSEKKQIMLDHIAEIHRFYGERLGVKFARKHIAWYLNRLPMNLVAQRSSINQQDTTVQQMAALEQLFSAIDAGSIAWVEQAVNPNNQQVAA